MRRILLGLLIVVVGCTAVPNLSPPSSDLKVVVGGISNTEPFFGDFKVAGSDVSSGLFMLASCGCGDWRVLFKPDDGSPQTQFPILFYSSGDYVPTGSVTVYGQDEASGRIVSGSVDQDGGLFSGKSQTGMTLNDVAGQRGAAHDQAVVACGLCHIGEDSIFPLPDWHPQKYKTDPTVCFECHTVNGQ